MIRIVVPVQSQRSRPKHSEMNNSECVESATASLARSLHWARSWLPVQRAVSYAHCGPDLSARRSRYDGRDGMEKFNPRPWS